MSELFNKHGGDEYEPTERDVKEVVEHYQKYHPRYRFKPKGHRSGEYELIVETLKFNDLETCKLAIDGLHMSDWHKERYTALEYAFRDKNLIPFAEAAEKEKMRQESAVRREREKIEKDREREKSRKEMMEMAEDGVSLRNSLRAALRSSRN
jgi:hypothetical protein